MMQQFKKWKLMLKVPMFQRKKPWMKFQLELKMVLIEPRCEQQQEEEKVCIQESFMLGIEFQSKSETDKGLLRATKIIDCCKENYQHIAEHVEILPIAQVIAPSRIPK